MRHPHSKRILAGEEEAIFGALPQRVLANLRISGSENALVWNLVYPLGPQISLQRMLSIRPLWGTAALEADDDALRPYFWGYGIDGEVLPGLEQSLDQVDGPGLQTEVDLFFLGERSLILAEAKNLSGLGRCSRFLKQRCPEIHPSPEENTCRYWESQLTPFENWLDFGKRPQPEDPAPPCSQHYQLGRTLLVGAQLARLLERDLYLWLIMPRGRWAGFRRTWKDFSDRVADEQLWRRMRVLAWEDLQDMGAGR